MNRSTVQDIFYTKSANVHFALYPARAFHSRNTVIQISALRLAYELGHPLIAARIHGTQSPVALA